MPIDLLAEQPKDLLSNQTSPEVSSKNSLIPQLTTQEKIDHPVVAGIDQLANNVATVGYDAVNGLSLGILGGIMGANKIQPPSFNMDNIPQQDQSVLKLAGDIANLGGAGKTIGAGFNLAGKALSPIIKPAIDTSTKLWNTVSDAWKADKLLPSANTLQESIDRIATQKDNINNAKQLLSNVTSLKVRGINSKIKDITDSVSSNTSNISKQIAQESKDLASTLKSEIGKKVSSTQEAVPTFFRNASKAYGDTLDNIISSVDSPVIAEGIIKKGAAPATKQEIFDKLSNLVDGETDPIISNSLPFKKIQLLKEKYNPESIVKSGLVDSTGKPIITNSGSETVDLKQLLGEMRDMNASLRAGVKSGTKAISPEDLMVSRYNYAIGDLVKDRVPAFAELQNSYAPVMKAKELAYKVFKPYKGDFGTTSAESFFKRVAFDNKMSGQDKALVDILQNGTTVKGTASGIEVPGIGDISSEIKSIGNKISQLSTDKVSKQLAVKSGASLDINSLQSQIKLLQDAKNMSSIKDVERLNTLNNRLDVIKNALNERNKIQDVKKMVAVGAAKTIGAGVLAKLGFDAVTHRQ